MKTCQITLDIIEKDATIGLTSERWDDEGNKLPDMPDEEFQKLFDSCKHKTYFYVDLTCSGKERRIRSPLADSTSREFILRRVLSDAIGQVISKQFDNLCT
jgi:hypothetical protein